MATKLCPYCAEEIQEAAIKCKHCNSWLSAAPGSLEGAAAQPDGYPPTTGSPTGKLMRSSTDSMCLGVCGGIGRHFGMDSTWVRIAYVLAMFASGVIPGIVLYFVLGIIVPLDDPGS